MCGQAALKDRCTTFICTTGRAGMVWRQPPWCSTGSTRPQGLPCDSSAKFARRQIMVVSRVHQNLTGCGRQGRGTEGMGEREELRAEHAGGKNDRGRETRNKVGIRPLRYVYKLKYTILPWANKRMPA